MLHRPRCQVDAGAPNLVQRLCCRIDHAGERFDALQLSHFCLWQRRLDRDAQALIIDWPYKPASQPNRRLLERHDLEAVTPVPCRRESGLPHREATVDNAR